MKQTNNYRPRPRYSVHDHIDAGIQLGCASLAELREGDILVVHRKVIEARDRLSIAEQMLAHQVFLLGESG